MPKTMIRVVAVILCLALLVAWSPMRAEAAVAETILLFGDDIIIAIVGCLIGLGVIASPTWYENTARNIYSDIQEEYSNNPDNVIFHSFTPGPDPDDPLHLNALRSLALGSALIAADVAEWIKGWLFDNEVLAENTETLYHEVGFKLDTTTSNTYSAAYWESLDAYSLVNSGSPGVLITNYSNGKYYGLVVGEDGQVDLGELSSLAPYAQDTLPMGVFVNDVTYTWRAHNDAYQLFNSYENAYNYWLSNKKAAYYFKETSKLSMDNQRTGVGATTVRNVGFISANGSIDSLSSISVAAYSSSSYGRNGLYPASYTETTIVPEEGVELGQVAGKDEDMATGYPGWSQGAVENNGTTYYPIGSAPSIDSMASMNQEQIWIGTAFPQSPLIDTSGYEAEITYSQGSAVDPLLAVASSPDGGYLTYQWYNGSVPIEGQVAPRFYPPVTEVGTATYSCQVGNFKEGIEGGSYAWTQPVKITVTEAPATGDDEDSIPVFLPDGWFSPILEFFEGLNTSEENEALQGGQAGIDGVIDVIPDFSGEFVGALTDFSGVLGYEGTAAVLVVPPLTIPAVQNLVPEYQLIGEQRVDLEEYVAMVPEGLLLLIRSLLTLALIAYCPKEFYDTIEYIITLKGGKD